MIYIKRFVLMLQFLTTIPIPINMDVNEEDFGKGLVFAPIVGVLLGAVLAGMHILLTPIFSKNITAALIVVLYIFLTGGLHIDGLGDTCDGIFSHRPKDRILEIMRDSRVGTNAVIGIVTVLFLDWLLLVEQTPPYQIQVLILFPVAGRIGSLIGAGVSRYARSGEGLGKSFIDLCGGKEIFAGLVFYFTIFYIAAGTRGLFAGVFPVVTALILVKVLGKKIGGATGDILGAVCELNQTLFLVTAYLIFT